MFSTPRKAISKYRPHPIFSSPIRLFGLFRGSSPTSSPSSPSSPPIYLHKSPNPSPSPIPTLRKKCYPANQQPPATPSPGPIEHTAPFKPFKAPSRLVRGKSNRIRRPVRKAVSVKGPTTTPSNMPQINKLWQETQKLVSATRIVLTNEDQIFIRELEKLNLHHEFRKELDAARDVADRGVNLEEMRKERNAKRLQDRKEKLEREEDEMDVAQATHPHSHIKNGKPVGLDSPVKDKVADEARSPRTRDGWQRKAAIPALLEQRRVALKIQEDRRVEKVRRQARLREENIRQEEIRFVEQQRQTEIRRVEEERLMEQRRLQEARFQEQMRIREQMRQREEARLRGEEQARLREEIRLREIRLQQEAYQQEQARIREQILLEEQARFREQARLMQEERLREALARAQAILDEQARLMQEEEARRTEEARFQAEFQTYCRVDEPMDLDSRASLMSTTIVTISNNDRYGIYENKWQLLRGDDKSDIPLLRFSQLPWPVLCDVTGLDQLTDQNFEQFFFNEDRPGYEDKSPRVRARTEIVRWHPDKFEGQVLEKVYAIDRDCVLEGVGRITRFLLGK